MNNLFFILLKNSLWGDMGSIPGELSDDVCGKLLCLAEKQAVSGLIIESILKNDIKLPQNRVFEAVGLAEQIKRNNLKINEGVKRLHLLLTDANIDYRIVKGQCVASYYTEPLFRQSGDIDYYCDEVNFSKSLDILKKYWRTDIDESDTDYHIHFNYSGVVYEGHFALVRLYNKRKENYWKQILKSDIENYVSIDNLNIKTLSPTIHALYIFLHLYSHLIKLGVGIRQFCDLAVLLHYAKNQIDYASLLTHLNKLGMRNAYSACGCILVDYLGLPESDLGVVLTRKDRLNGEKVLKVVLYRGNMGHYNRFSGYIGWKHTLEATAIKTSHLMKFMRLSPDYVSRWFLYQFKKLF